MKQLKMFWAIVFIAVTMCWLMSCEKEMEPSEQIQQLDMLESDSLRMIKLGKKLENPYSVKNMRLAYSNLMKKMAKQNKSYYGETFKDSTAVVTTDYYVKFWIENDEQKNKLLSDSLNLSIVPLDVEIEQEGDYFVDESTEIQEAMWLYTSVAKDYNFPAWITHEKLENLFLIEESGAEEEEGDEEEDETTTTTIADKTGISKQFLYDLEDEALLITGNYEPTKDTLDNNLDGRRSKKRPKGYIKVYNTVTKKFDPVVGVKIKTRRWFKWAKGWTNLQGYYKVNRGYRRNVRYTVVFKNTRGFKIWPSVVSISSARYRAGKHSKYGHNINFYTSSVGWRWATVNNATVKYFNYCSQLGIGKPHNNLRIVALGGTGYSSAPMLRRVWGIIGFTSKSKVSTFLAKANKISVIGNALLIMLKFVLPDVIIRAGASKGTDRVFSTTFHELAHASHFKKVGSGYWIKYINYIITYGAYGNGHGKNAEVCGIGEMWGNYLSAFYMDKEFPASYPNHGSHDYLIEKEDWYNPGFLQDADNISDISTAEIFSCLKSTTDTFIDLKNELKTKTTQDEKIDKAFANYSDWP